MKKYSKILEVRFVATVNFDEKIKEACQAFGITEEEFRASMEKAKKFLRQLYKKEPDDINAFNRVMAELQRKTVVGGGQPYIGVVYSVDAIVERWVDSSGKTAADRARECIDMFNKDPVRAVNEGYVASRDIQLRYDVPQGHPLGTDGKPLKRRPMAILRVALAPEPMKENQIALPPYLVVYTAYLHDDAAKNAVNIPLFKWAKITGYPSRPAEGEEVSTIFNITGEIEEIGEELEGVRPYEVLKEINGLFIDIDDIPAWFTSQTDIESFTTQAGIRMTRCNQTIVVDGNVISINKNPVERGNRKFFTMILTSSFATDPDCLKLRVNVPDYIPINFLEGSRIVVAGRVSKNEETETYSMDAGAIGWTEFTLPEVDTEVPPDFLSAEIPVKGEVKEKPLTQPVVQPQPQPTPQVAQPQVAQPVTNPTTNIPASPNPPAPPQAIVEGSEPKPTMTVETSEVRKPAQAPEPEVEDEEEEFDW